MAAPLALRRWVSQSPGGLLGLSVLTGAGAALFAVVFRWLISAFTRLFTGASDYAAVAGQANPHLPGLGRWFVIGAPVVAGLLYGPLVHLFAREARGHGVPEVMYAVSHRGGRIAPQVAVVKALASALCIGGGGSVGREGPIVQIGSALGSTVGRATRLPESRLRVLVACGAAGGIAATFNAPLAGVFFAMELILASFVTEAFGMVVVASVTASVIGRGILGNEPFLRLPTFTVANPVDYLLFAALGLGAGLVGVGFTRVLYAVEDACDSLWRGPEWLRPAVGGILLGALLLAVPQMYGVGYPVLGAAVNGRYVVWALLGLLAAKAVATSLTIGIGGSGGVFAPSLFLGAMLGSAFGAVAGDLLPGVAGPAGAYGLVGMGAVFAGASRAPITAVVIMFELTGEYSIVLPLMVAIALATGVSHRLSGDTIYTLKLRRRGDHLARHETIDRVHRPVTEVMRPAPDALPVETSLLDGVDRLLVVPGGVLPVVDCHGVCVGTVSASALADAIAEGRDDGTLDAVLDPLVPLTDRDDIETAIKALDRTGHWAVPIVSNGSQALVGWLDYRDALASATGRPRPTRGSN